MGFTIDFYRTDQNSDITYCGTDESSDVYYSRNAYEMA